MLVTLTGIDVRQNMGRRNSVIESATLTHHVSTTGLSPISRISRASRINSFLPPSTTCLLTPVALVIMHLFFAPIARSLSEEQGTRYARLGFYGTWEFEFQIVVIMP